MVSLLWQQCLRSLENDLSSQQFSIYITPLQTTSSASSLTVLAPNTFIRDKVDNNFRKHITDAAHEHGIDNVEILVGSTPCITKSHVSSEPPASRNQFHGRLNGHKTRPKVTKVTKVTQLNNAFTFDSFVVGDSNKFAQAAALQVSENLDKNARSLLLYGGVGLGKTHLMHAVGNAMLMKNTHLKVASMYARDFTEEMVHAIKQGAMSEFTEHYHGLDVLLMDDIQFLVKGPKSQEEVFHLFNRLQEKGSQIVFTCDRCPRELERLEERLRSRFLWCMNARLEAPDEETRVAILMKKAESDKVDLPYPAAVFIAKNIRSNVRELEGALKRVIAAAKFASRDISIDQVKEALRDLLAIQAWQVGIDNIQKIVANYYKIRLADMHTKRRNLSVVRPRQIAMALARDLTNHSLPDIGRSFGGRDHTTVLHACKKVEELKESNISIREDYNNLLGLLT